MANIVSEYIKTLLIGDMTMETTVSLPAGKFVPLMYVRVPVRNRYFVGNGKINLGVDDRGTYKLSVEDASGTVIAGAARLKILDSNQLNGVFIRDDISSDLTSGVKTGIGGKTGNENALPAADEYEYIMVEYAATSADTAAASETTIFLPVTIQALN